MTNLFSKRSASILLSILFYHFGRGLERAHAAGELFAGMLSHQQYINLNVIFAYVNVIILISFFAGGGSQN